MADLILRTDVNIDTLLKQNNVKLSAEQKKKVQEFSSGGFDEDELAELKKIGVDKSTIEKLCKKSDDTASKKTKEEITAKADEIKDKYCKDLEPYHGDRNSAKNPELQAFDKALDDGIIADLKKDGFNRIDITKVLSLAFPRIGIKPDNDSKKASIPRGHDKEASEIYEKYEDKLGLDIEDSPELIAAREELKKSYQKIEQNNKELRNIETNVIELQSEIQTTIDKAIEESEEIQEEQKEETKKAVNKRLEEYASSNGEMTYDEFKKNLSGDLDKISGEANSRLSAVLSDMLDAEKKMGVLNGYLSDMDKLSKENELETKNISKNKENIEKLEKEQEEKAKAEAEAEKCDPIGFESSSVKYDLFVDKDKNGDITNAQEFLGAKDGFDEMKALDANNDGIINADELEKGNVKFIKTNSDGTQSILNASQVFKDGDSINLNSYVEHNKTLDNGNELLGKFDVNFGGKTLDDAGYQTLDKQDWLDDNYEFTDEKNKIGRYADSENIFTGNGDVSAYEIDIDKYQKITLNLQKNLEKTTQEIKKQRDDIPRQMAHELELALNKANVTEAEFERQEQKEQIEEDAQIREQEQLEEQERIEEEQEIATEKIKDKEELEEKE